MWSALSVTCSVMLLAQCAHAQTAVDSIVANIPLIDGVWSRADRGLSIGGAGSWMAISENGDGTAVELVYSYLVSQNSTSSCEFDEAELVPVSYAARPWVQQSLSFAQRSGSSSLSTPLCQTGTVDAKEWKSASFPDRGNICASGTVNASEITTLTRVPTVNNDDRLPACTNKISTLGTFPNRPIPSSMTQLPTLGAPSFLAGYYLTENVDPRLDPSTDTTTYLNLQTAVFIPGGIISFADWNEALNAMRGGFAQQLSYECLGPYEWKAFTRWYAMDFSPLFVRCAQFKMDPETRNIAVHASDFSPENCPLDKEWNITDTSSWRTSELKFIKPLKNDDGMNLQPCSVPPQPAPAPAPAPGPPSGSAKLGVSSLQQGTAWLCILISLLAGSNYVSW